MSWQPIESLKPGRFRWVYLARAGDPSSFVGRMLTKAETKWSGFLYEVPASSFNPEWDRDWQPTHWQPGPKGRQPKTQEERRAAVRRSRASKRVYPQPPAKEEGGAETPPPPSPMPKQSGNSVS
jgi:hypothetical protein